MFSSVVVLCRIQREMAFLNQLLDFNRLLFIKHPHPHFYQWSIFQFLGTTAVGGGGLFVLDDYFSQKPVLRDLVAETECETGRLKGRKLGKGDFLSPELSWDGRTVYFAYTEHANGLVRPEPDEAYWAKRRANPLYKTGGGGMGEEDYLETIRTTESCYHVFSVGADGKGLRQLTDGPVNDFDPVELPNGRIAFVSERRGGFGRSTSTRAYSLHTMEPDGSDIVRISHHEQNEFQPSVDHDGMILYTRWDTWDRNYEMPQGMWTTFPDGRDARAPIGNYVFGNEVSVPTGVNDLRAVPGSRKIMGLESTYSDYFYGSVVLVDPTVPEHGSHPDKFKRLTPDQGWGHASMERTRYGGPCRYTTPWPLSEGFFLCAYDDQARMNTGPLNRYAVYLADAFGNRVLLYRDPAIACQSPMPLRARSRPPAIPHRTAIGKPRRAAADGAQGGASSVAPGAIDHMGRGHAGSEAGTAPALTAVTNVNVAHPISAAVGGMAEVGVMNIYTATLPFPKGTKITALRIIQTAAKTVAGRNNPTVGYGNGYGWDKGGRMVLGTVPVEEDGSAYFTMPAGVPVYFQAVDDQGLAMQTMRTTAYAQPGERLMCLGCHELRGRTPSATTNVPLALKRAPSTIAPDVPESNPLTFPRLVQPVLDKHCVSCHNPKEGHTRASDRKDRYCFEFNNSSGRAAIEPADCKKPDLTAGDWRQGQRIQHGNDEKLDLVGTEYWFTSYKNLGRYVKGFWGHQGDGPPETRPGTYLARESALYQHLKRGHKDVRLSADEMHRLVLWMDCNSMFYCATTDLYKQAAGEVVLPEHE